MVTTVVRAAREEAFRFFTEEIDAWWKHGPRFRVHAHRESTMRLEPRVGGHFLEVYCGGDAFEIGEVLVWEPPTRVVFQMGGRDFKPDEHTEVEVRFESVDQGTRVIVHQTGWDTLRPDHPARHGHEGEALTGMIGVWWADQLTALRTQTPRRRQKKGTVRTVPFFWRVSSQVGSKTEVIKLEGGLSSPVSSKPMRIPGARQCVDAAGSLFS